MEGLPARAGHYFCAPICLLYVNKVGNLVPVAIQLKQNGDGTANLIFLPSDSWIDWLTAKIYYHAECTRPGPYITINCSSYIPACMHACIII